MSKNKAGKGSRKTNKEIAPKNLEERCDYYEPKNEKEEREYILARLIRLREDSIRRNTVRIANLEKSIKMFELEGEIHQRVLKNATRPQVEEWKYNWSMDYNVSETSELQKLKDSAEYDLVWIKEAKKFITTKKYQNIPNEFCGLDFMDKIDDELCDCPDCAGGCCDKDNTESVDISF